MSQLCWHMQSYQKFLGNKTLIIVNYLQNWSLTKANYNETTPYEFWFGHQINLSHFKIFGCKFHAFIHKETWWNPYTHFIQCIFLSYNDESKAYNLMTTSGCQVLISKDVPTMALAPPSQPPSSPCSCGAATFVV